jgi:HPt (histidine-containing phosphotransfer) domain-containing protein
MPLYAIHAHALKSAAANIGAVALSDAAKALEMAGKQEDLGFVEAHSPGFFADVETLLAEIHSRLVAHRGDGEATGSPLDPQSLKNRLTRLKLAIETLDAREMNDAIDYLLSQKLPDSINASIQNISRCLLTAEYDEALALTESLL